MVKVLITGARAPVALHLAREFVAAGHRVVLADTMRFPFSRATRAKDAYRRLPSPRLGLDAFYGALAALVTSAAPDLVVPICEEVFYLAAARDLRGLPIPLFAPPFDLLARVHNKADFALIAAGHGADPPPTRRLQTQGDVACLAPLAGGLVFKPAWSRFGSRVLIRPGPEGLGRVRPSAASPWVAQDYLPGEELCAYAVAHRGRLVAFQAYKPAYRAGQGAGVAFDAVREPVARAFALSLIEQLGWHGQISFDFRRDAAGRLRVIECNPRATSGLHFFAPGDGLGAAILSGTPAEPSVSGGMTLPLAMLCYGLPNALRQLGARRGLAQWARDARRLKNLSSAPGDRSMLLPQLAALAEIAGRALWQRIGLIEAAVRDIEWDGEPLG